MNPSNHWEDLASKLGAEPVSETPAAETPPPKPSPPSPPRAITPAPRPPRATTNWSSLACNLGIEPVEAPPVAGAAPGNQPPAEPPATVPSEWTHAGPVSTAAPADAPGRPGSMWSQDATDSGDSPTAPESAPRPPQPYRPSFMQPAYPPDLSLRQAAEKRPERQPPEARRQEERRHEERPPRTSDDSGNRRSARRGSLDQPAPSFAAADLPGEPLLDPDDATHAPGVEAMLDEIRDIEVVETEYEGEQLELGDSVENPDESPAARPPRRRRRRGGRNRRGRRPESVEREEPQGRSERGEDRARPAPGAEGSHAAEGEFEPLAEGGDDEDSGLAYVRPDSEELNPVGWEEGELGAPTGEQADFGSMGDAEAGGTWSERPEREAGESEGDRDRRRRRRRRRSRPSEGRSPQPAAQESPDEPSSAADPEGAADLYGEDLDQSHDAEGDGEDDNGGKISHKAIPTWEETVGVLIEVNLEARARSPRGDGPRGRGRGRSRGGYRGGNGASRPPGPQNSGS